MATLVDSLVQTVLRDGWGLVESYGVTPFSVSVRQYTWDSGEVGIGERTTADTPIKPNPERRLNSDESITLVPIIPPGVNTSYTYEDLNRQDESGRHFVYVVVGPNGEKLYTFGGLDTSSPFEWKLRLIPLSTAGPDG